MEIKYKELQNNYISLKIEYMKILKQLEIKCEYCGKELELTEVQNNKLKFGKDIFFHKVWCYDCDTYLFEAKPKKGYIKV